MQLQYKTFNQLMSSVSSDLGRYADEGGIDEILYIKEARKVNAELGLKIHKEKEVIIDVYNYKACLPTDFLYLQLALACSVSYVTVPKIQGVHTEDKEIPLTNSCNSCGQVPCSCNNCKIQFKACDGYKYVAQTIGIKTHKYEHLELISLTKTSNRFCSDECLNLNFNSSNVMNIMGEEATFSFREGKVYLNYLSDMTDENGNFLILDHPLTNDYYEYAVKKKFFENLKFNKDGDVAQDLQYVMTQLREARIRAISLVNMPEYDEINKFFLDNRKRFYNNYVKHFENLDQGHHQF